MAGFLHKNFQKELAFYIFMCYNIYIIRNKGGQEYEYIL